MSGVSFEQFVLLHQTDRLMENMFFKVESMWFVFVTAVSSSSSRN